MGLLQQYIKQTFIKYNRAKRLNFIQRNRESVSLMGQNILSLISKLKKNQNSVLMQGLYDYLKQKPDENVQRKVDYYITPYSGHFGSEKFMSFDDPLTEETTSQTGQGWTDFKRMVFGMNTD